MLAMDISRSLTPELFSAANALSRRRTVGLSAPRETKLLVSSTHHPISAVVLHLGSAKEKLGVCQYMKTLAM